MAVEVKHVRRTFTEGEIDTPILPEPTEVCHGQLEYAALFADLRWDGLIDDYGTLKAQTTVLDVKDGARGEEEKPRFPCAEHGRVPALGEPFKNARAVLVGYPTKVWEALQKFWAKVSEGSRLAKKRNRTAFLEEKEATTRLLPADGEGPQGERNPRAQEQDDGSDDEGEATEDYAEDLESEADEAAPEQPAQASSSSSAAKAQPEKDEDEDFYKSKLRKSLKDRGKDKAPYDWSKTAFRHEVLRDFMNIKEWRSAVVYYDSTSLRIKSAFLPESSAPESHGERPVTTGRQAGANPNGFCEQFSKGGTGGMYLKGTNARCEKAQSCSKAIAWRGEKAAVGNMCMFGSHVAPNFSSLEDAGRMCRYGHGKGGKTFKPRVEGVEEVVDEFAADFAVREARAVPAGAASRLAIMQQLDKSGDWVLMPKDRLEKIDKKRRDAAGGSAKALKSGSAEGGGESLGGEREPKGSSAAAPEAFDPVLDNRNRGHNRYNGMHICSKSQNYVVMCHSDSSADGTLETIYFYSPFWRKCGAKEQNEFCVGHSWMFFAGGIFQLPMGKGDGSMVWVHCSNPDPLYHGTLPTFTKRAEKQENILHGGMGCAFLLQENVSRFLHDKVPRPANMKVWAKSSNAAKFFKKSRQGGGKKQILVDVAKAKMKMKMKLMKTKSGASKAAAGGAPEHPLTEEERKRRRRERSRERARQQRERRLAAAAAEQKQGASASAPKEAAAPANKSRLQSKAAQAQRLKSKAADKTTSASSSTSCSTRLIWIYRNKLFLNGGTTTSDTTRLAVTKHLQAQDESLDWNAGQRKTKRIREYFLANPEVDGVRFCTKTDAVTSTRSYKKEREQAAGRDKGEGAECNGPAGASAGKGASSSAKRTTGAATSCSADDGGPLLSAKSSVEEAGGSSSSSSSSAAQFAEALLSEKAEIVFGVDGPEVVGWKAERDEKPLKSDRSRTITPPGDAVGSSSSSSKADGIGAGKGIFARASSKMNSECASAQASRKQTQSHEQPSVAAAGDHVGAVENDSEMIEIEMDEDSQLEVYEDVRFSNEFSLSSGSPADAAANVRDEGSKKPVASMDSVNGKDDEDGLAVPEVRDCSKTPSDSGDGARSPEVLPLVSEDDGGAQGAKQEKRQRSDGSCNEDKDLKRQRRDPDGVFVDGDAGLFSEERFQARSPPRGAE